MSPRTALPEQPSLFDPEPAPAPPPPAPAKTAKKAPRRSNRRHVLGLPRPWAKNLPCAEVCLVCRRPEEVGVCPSGCTVVCGRPDRTGPVEICLITTTAPTRAVPGRRWLLATCPRCRRTNWHPPTPGRTYRTGQCGHPYIVTTEPTP